jgi:hypothetical protein
MAPPFALKRSVVKYLLIWAFLCFTFRLLGESWKLLNEKQKY